MQNVYLTEKNKKKKATLQFVWILVLFGILFVILITRFALSGSQEDIFSGAPSSNDVYEIAKEFVKPTLKGEIADFSDSQYQFGQKPDSVYVIKSFVQTKDNAGEDRKTNFEIILKYKGGSKSAPQNWEVLNLSEF
jgi:hypothetical protein